MFLEELVANVEDWGMKHGEILVGFDFRLCALRLCHRHVIPTQSTIGLGQSSTRSEDDLSIPLI